MESTDVTEQSFFFKGNFFMKKVLIMPLCPVMPESAAMSAVFTCDLVPEFEILHKKRNVLLFIMLFFLAFLL